MNEPVERDPLASGVTVGKRFRLEKLLGRGAMGSVWKATHTALSSPVAIKFLDRAKIADADEVEMRLDRFRFEAQVSARISAVTHRTVAVHDAGVFGHIPYLVMEYAPGRTVEDVLAETGPLTLDEAAKVAEHISEALGAAHNLGIIHRDVKLANILRVERDGAPITYKLGDFGVARVVGEAEIDLRAPKKTAEGLIVGTPAYMSPEQIGAETEYGPPADLWALGVVLYEAITGRLPFNSRSLTELAMAISGRGHEPPSQAASHIGPALDAFFDVALAKRPVDRFPDAAALAKAFHAAVSRDSAPPPPPVEKTNWIARGAVIAAALVFLIGLVAWFQRPTVALNTTTETGASDTPKAEPTPASTGAVADTRGISVSTLPEAVTPSKTVSASTGKRVEPPPPATVTPASTPPEPPPAETAAPKPTQDPSLKRPPIDKSMIQ